MRGFYANPQKEPLHIANPDGMCVTILSKPILNHLDRSVNTENESSDAAVLPEAVLLVRQWTILDIIGKTVQASSVCRSIS